MKDSVSVHVVNGLDKLIHVVLYSVLGQVMSLAFDGIVHVHVHQFENEGEAARGFVAEKVS